MSLRRDLVLLSESLLGKGGGVGASGISPVEGRRSSLSCSTISILLDVEGLKSSNANSRSSCDFSGIRSDFDVRRVE